MRKLIKFWNCNPHCQILVFAFAFEKSLQEIEIVLSGNKGAFSEAFTPLSLAGINRPAKLELESPNFKTFNEEAFTLYFVQHPKHVIFFVPFRQISCDCNNLWLWRNKDKYRKRFLKYEDKETMLCDNYKNKLIWDLNEDDFGNCTSF